MKQFIVDAFTEQLFHGNPAAVCVLEEWLSEKQMRLIAAENNLSETAFTVKSGNGYELRWFTPGEEVSLCGHATLGTAYVLFHYYEPGAKTLIFHTASGVLYVNRQNDWILMDFPIYQYQEIPVTEQMTQALGAVPVKSYLSRDLLLIYDDEEIIYNITPNFEVVKLLPGDSVSITAPGKYYDCVSRSFAPKLKIQEDPVTGSVHCMIAPYWSERLGKKSIYAYQASERGGVLRCEMRDERVIIAGKAVLYAIAELMIDSIA